MILTVVLRLWDWSCDWFCILENYESSAAVFFRRLDSDDMLCHSGLTLNQMELIAKTHIIHSLTHNQIKDDYTIKA